MSSPTSGNGASSHHVTGGGGEGVPGMCTGHVLVQVCVYRYVGPANGTQSQPQRPSVSAKTGYSFFKGEGGRGGGQSTGC